MIRISFRGGEIDDVNGILANTRLIGVNVNGFPIARLRYVVI
jgi:hypothetical protein